MRFMNKRGLKKKCNSFGFIIVNINFFIIYMGLYRKRKSGIILD